MLEERKRVFGRALRWTWAATAAVMFHLFLFWAVFFTRDSQQKLRRLSRQVMEIEYFDEQAKDRSAVLNQQQMDLFDPRPLLLPTQWNAASVGRLGEFLQVDEQIFEDFAPMFELEDGNYLDDFGNAAANYDRLSVAQVDFSFQLFDQLGRESGRTDFAQEVGLFATLSDPRSGRELASATIYNEAIETFLGRWPSWPPVTFLVTVEDSFRLGGFSMLASSGQDDLDEALRGLADLVFSRIGQVEDGAYLLEMVP